jgi:hypothetical protein
MARCPAHDDRVPSLSINAAGDGKILVHCHAGCSQRAVIDVLRGRGLWNSSYRSREIRPAARPVAANSGVSGVAGSTKAALGLWDAARPAAGTIVETYIEARGLRFEPCDALRFHPALKHPSGEFFPAMIGLVTGGRDDTARAVHRTFLSRDGSAKAGVEPNRMMLGPCRGGAIRLAPAGDVLMVGEGIETCLSAMQLMGLPTWAALSAPGLRTLVLPATVSSVVVLADGDDVGEAAAQDCERRWADEGRRVSIMRPPRGIDFNDVLRGTFAVGRTGQ